MSETMIIIVRAMIAFFSLLVLCRILGKTQRSQMTFFEYVMGITIGAIAGRFSIDIAHPPWPIYAGLLTWFVLTLLTQFATLKSRWFGKLMDGEPVILVQNGQILERNLRMLRMPADELNSILREKDIFDLSQVEFAVFEPHGQLSVLKRSQDRPVTPADLQLPTAYEGMGVDLIMDGQVVEQNLRRLHLNRAWLNERLREQGVSSPEEVFLAVLDTRGQIYVDLYRDRVPAVNDVSDYPGPN